MKSHQKHKSQIKKSINPSKSLALEVRAAKLVLGRQNPPSALRLFAGQCATLRPLLPDTRRAPALDHLEIILARRQRQLEIQLVPHRLLDLGLVQVKPMRDGPDHLANNAPHLVLV